MRELKGFADRLVLGVAETGAPAQEPAASLPLPKRVELYEKKLLCEALDAVQGNVSQAASDLGIPKKTLYDKLKRYEIGGARFSGMSD